jgi:hypothetical protein
MRNAQRGITSFVRKGRLKGTEYERLMKMLSKHVCPNGCNSGFYTTAHVMQEWKLDNNGNYIETMEDCLEVTAYPHDDNVWACAKCGAEAEIQRATQCVYFKNLGECYCNNEDGDYGECIYEMGYKPTDSPIVCNYYKPQ